MLPLRFFIGHKAHDLLESCCVIWVMKTRYKTYVSLYLQMNLYMEDVKTESLAAH